MSVLRPPDQVMRLPRMGAAFPTRLSFMRVVLRRLAAGGWRFDRPLWEIGEDGTGRAVYRLSGEGQCVSLVAFAHDLPDALRSDRVIAEAWDATFALVDGTPDASDLDRLGANVPLQEAGRITDRELSLSRANRSTRLWDHVVGRLASGQQPEPERLAEVGYLMRTTAVYGSGKFGAADHASLRGRGLLDGPFRAEMIAVWLIRAFSVDLVEHMAAIAGGARAVRLDRTLRRSLGIGNATGLGMAPFLVNHPELLHAWTNGREQAFARVRAVRSATPEKREAFAKSLERARAATAAWQSGDTTQMARWRDLRGDLDRLATHVSHGALAGEEPWERLWRWAEQTLTLDGQEMCVSLCLEPYAELVDDLADTMCVDETASMRIDGTMTLGALRKRLREDYGWALSLDLTDCDAIARFWYVSEAKQEPRLGQRFEEPGAELERPLGIAREAQALARDLAGIADPDTSVGSEPYSPVCPDTAVWSVADFLDAHPEHRRMVRRVQKLAHAPYGEIRDNLLDSRMRPIDMLRFKLAFFGATNFDPRSDRWLRITMYQGAPFPGELHGADPDDWLYAAPPVREAAQ